MWVLDFTLHAWLSSSLLLPFMLLLRWAGGKWRRLRWLTRSPKRWLVIWSCFGFVKVAAISSLLFAESVDAFDLLGWASRAEFPLGAALHLEHVEADLLLAVLLGSVGEAAIDCGLAALSWWLFSRFKQRSAVPGPALMMQRYGIGLLLSAWAFAIANRVNFRYAYVCCDFVSSYGVPFTFLKQGGFVGITIYLWRGIVADALAVVLVGAVAGWIWSRLSREGAGTRVDSVLKKPLE